MDKTKKMLITDYIKDKYEVHPFILEVLKSEGMDNFFAWEGLSADIETLENFIRKNHFIYKKFNLYFNGQIENFHIKLADRIILKNMENDIVEKK